MNGSIHLGIIAGAVAIGLSGCGGGDNLVVGNAKAVGSVGGMIVDAETRSPLAGVEVVLIAGGQRFETQVTAEEGLFAFDDVPAGQILLTLTAPGGYQDAWVRDEIPSNAGEFPTGNAAVTVGPIGLIQAQSDLRIRVLDQDGRPVSPYEVLMHTFTQYVDFSSGTATSQGQTQTSAMTDIDGYAVFQGIPNFFRLGPSVRDDVLFLLQPLDADGDGAYEFAGGDQLLNLRELGDPTPDLVLDADYNTALEIRASNLDSLAAVVVEDPEVPAPVQAAASTPPTVLATNESIYVAFNLPIIAADTLVNVTDEEGRPLTMPPAVSVQGDLLTIGFGSSPLDAAREYNVHIRARSEIGNRVITADFIAAFFTRSDSEAVSSSAVRITGTGTLEAAVIEFGEPLGNGDPNNPTVLTGDNCVVFFGVDLDGSDTVGDAPGEVGNDSCALDGIALTAVEPEPLGLPGRSGYTRFWQLDLPNVGATPAPLPEGSEVIINFGQVNNGAFYIERPNGRPAPELTVTIP